MKSRSNLFKKPHSKIKKSQGTKSPSNRHQGSAQTERSPAVRSQGDLQIPKSWRAVAGQHAIDESLRVHSAKVQQLWLRQGWESSEQLRGLEERSRKLKIKCEVKSTAILDKLCATHQGAALFIEGRPLFNIESLQNYDRSILLTLDGIEDPHNLGAILRTSWLMGVHGLMIPEDRAVGLTPTVHKVACGGVEHVPVEALTNFTNHIEQLKKQGYWVFGLSHKAKSSLFDVKIPEKIIWAIGAEDKGLRGTTERLCDDLVSIPQISAAASYNASVATAIALTETYRQHIIKT